MSISTQRLRNAWAGYGCDESKMERISFGPDFIRVAAPTVDAWKALEKVLAAHGYDIRIEDTDSYNCRAVKGGGGLSLHAYGIALDINWKTNPYRDHQGRRAPRFSSEVTQGARAEHVRLGLADTDMTRDTIIAALAIRTNAGKQVFGWGGNWATLKDAMHFQIEVTPAELAAGIDWSTVPLPAVRTAAPPVAGRRPLLRILAGLRRRILNGLGRTAGG
ncbi:MAG TPA: M15 family metallopeptidase [Rhizobiaceae bacterium]|nr:M15 family metallopeptidase [Rhizobiaceae bacterium]